MVGGGGTAAAGEKEDARDLSLGWGRSWPVVLEKDPAGHGEQTASDGCVAPAPRHTHPQHVRSLSPSTMARPRPWVGVTVWLRLHLRGAVSEPCVWRKGIGWGMGGAVVKGLEKEMRRG